MHADDRAALQLEVGDRVPGGQHVASAQGWDQHGQPLVVHLYDQGES